MDRNDKRKIIPQMFDIRPTDQSGALDMRRIGKISRIAQIETGFPDKSPGQKREAEEAKAVYQMKLRNRQVSEEIKRDGVRLYQLDEVFDPERVPVVYQSGFSPERKYSEVGAWKADIRERDEMSGRWGMLSDLSLKTGKLFLRLLEILGERVYFGFLSGRRLFKRKRPALFGASKNRIRKGKEVGIIEKTGRPYTFSELFFSAGHLDHLGLRSLARSFAFISLLIFCLISGTGFVYRALGLKEAIFSDSQKAYASLSSAKEEISRKNFDQSSSDFNSAYERFDDIHKELDSFGGILVEPARYFPYVSKISSGSHMAQAGKDISRSGVLIGEIIKMLDKIKNPLDSDSQVSLLKIFQETDKNLQEVARLLKDAEDNLDQVKIDDLPEDKRPEFLALKEKLPEVNGFIEGFIEDSRIFTDILGGNGPRKYLFLLQNNQEMRATGGFIGTYGILDIFDGRVRKFFVDGIFNPDGQLREKVVPPAPIQKISAAWSLHDSNWFPDFPKSAEKASWFYEKTGGPTVDGIITMTPTVMQKLLEVTGPIEMPEYGLTLDSENFLEKTQEEVEVNYDKEINQPKKILADLAPKVLDRLFNVKNFSDVVKTINILSESLNEKHILIYSRNYEIEKIISEKGWSGEVLDTQKDYLSIINSNINGFKTDSMIEEEIAHEAKIMSDGSVIDTVTVTRHHKGGSMQYEWLNKVNADYMRVYVPKGSRLISAEGQTREFNSPPLDYGALNFKRDPQVEMEEESMTVDPETGTRIYEDSGKTVFANWVYVSPQETVTMKYKYLLPFRLDISQGGKSVDTYSLLVQKQSGSLGSDFSSRIIHPDDIRDSWHYPDELSESSENINENERGLKLDTDLKLDRFVGIAFQREAE